jgi:hypothetical protein
MVEILDLVGRGDGRFEVGPPFLAIEQYRSPEYRVVDGPSASDPDFVNECVEEDFDGSRRSFRHRLGYLITEFR